MDKMKLTCTAIRSLAVGAAINVYGTDPTSAWEGCASSFYYQACETGGQRCFCASDGQAGTNNMMCGSNAACNWNCSADTTPLCC